MELASAIQLLELSTLSAEGLPLLMDLLITAASIAVRDIQSIQIAGLMKLVSYELQLPEESLNSLVGALAHRILRLGLKTFRPGDQEKIKAFCARYAWNVEVPAALVYLEQRHLDAGFQAVHSPDEVSPTGSNLSNSSWLFQAVQNTGDASPSHLSNSFWSSSCGELSAWQLQCAHVLAQWPEYQTMDVTPGSVLPQTTWYSIDKLLPGDAEREECCSVASTSVGNPSDLGISSTDSEPEAVYEVKNTFVHIPTRKCSVDRSRARSLDVARVR